jgi:hypothetical protein
LFFAAYVTHIPCKELALGAKNAKLQRTGATACRAESCARQTPEPFSRAPERKAVQGTLAAAKNCKELTRAGKPTLLQ